MTKVHRDPFTGSNFRVEIDGIPGSAALTVTLPEARIVRPGETETVQHGPLILQRGLTSDAHWYAWWNDARESRGSWRRTVSIVLLDGRGAPAWRWTFANSEPTAYRVSALDSMASAPVIETLDLEVRAFEAACAGPDQPAQ